MSNIWFRIRLWFVHVVFGPAAAQLLIARQAGWVGSSKPLPALTKDEERKQMKQWIEKIEENDNEL